MASTARILNEFFRHKEATKSFSLQCLRIFSAKNKKTKGKEGIIDEKTVVKKHKQSLKQKLANVNTELIICSYSFSRRSLFFLETVSRCFSMLFAKNFLFLSASMFFRFIFSRFSPSRAVDHDFESSLKINFSRTAE